MYQHDKVGFVIWMVIIGFFALLILREVTRISYRYARSYYRLFFTNEGRAERAGKLVDRITTYLPVHKVPLSSATLANLQKLRENIDFAESTDKDIRRAKVDSLATEIEKTCEGVAFD